MTEEQQNKWKLENITLLAWLLSQENPHDFIASMQRAVKQYGALTPRQTAAVEKWRYQTLKREEIQKREQEQMENVPALNEGRQILTGEVLSTKWHDSDYGTTPKMVIRLLDGNKVWGTIPADIENTTEGDIDELVGKSVILMATVKVSDKDPHFGFYSRPKDGKVL